MIGRGSPFVLLAALPFLDARQGAVGPPSVVPYNATGIYAVGERVGWTLTSGEGKYRYTLKANNGVLLGEGDVDLARGQTTVEATLRKPAMLYLELTQPGSRPFSYGAAVAPTRIKPVVPRPKDFDAFWKRKLNELRAVPENPVVVPGASYKPEVEYATLRMDSVNGTFVYGQLAKPRPPGKYPAMVVFQWASPPYPLQKPWVIEPAAQGWLVLNIEPHNVPVDAPPAFYQGLPPAIKNYASINQQDRETNYFVEMYLRDFRAVDYLSHHPEWDGKTLLVMGTSMGGQQSFAAAGLHPKVTHMIVNVPAGADLNAGFHGRQPGYPNFRLDDPKAMETARYVDAVNFAPRIKATSLVAMGFTDTVAPPAGIWTAFNLIRGKKEAAPMVDSPHNNLATPEQQRPYTQRAAEWLDSLVKTGKVEPRRDVGRS